MSAREKILSAVAANQPALRPLPALDLPFQADWNTCEKFTEVATAIGSRVFNVDSFDEIGNVVRQLFPVPGRVVSSFQELEAIAETGPVGSDPHLLKDVNLAVLKAQHGVAENGALWLSENEMMIRILPFICQHLALVVERKDIVNTMHDAYRILGNSNPGFGAFIAGPSKTADIEQSLVLGAHGPRSLTVFVKS